MKQNTGEIPHQRTNPLDTIIRGAHRQDAELLVELGKRAFYRRWHFKVVDRQQFVVGSDVQNDFIFRRDLSV